MQATSNRQIRPDRPVKLGWRAWFKTTRPANALSAPIVYGMFFPLLLLDFSISFYQATCFPLYGLPKVDRKRYIALDRRRLLILNIFDRISCEFCSYANGVLAFAQERPGSPLGDRAVLVSHQACPGHRRGP
jgi:hypothetical protein